MKHGQSQTVSAQRFRRLERLCLRVRDLARSREFYTGFFGFRSADPASPNGGAVLRLIGPEDSDLVMLELSEGLPAGTYLTGLDHISFEAANPDVVQQIYEAALEQSVQATHPRVDRNRWRTFLFDPDGYKIEVFTTRPS